MCAPAHLLVSRGVARGCADHLLEGRGHLLGGRGFVRSKAGLPAWPMSSGKLSSILKAGSFESIYLFDNESGAEEDLEGSNNLTPVSAPTQGVDVPALRGKCVQFADGSLQSMDAAAASTFEVNAATSLLIIGAFICTAPTANNRALCGNRTSLAGNPGYEVLFYPTTGNLAFIADDGTDQEVQIGNGYRDGKPYLFMARLDRAADAGAGIFGLYTKLESSEAAVSVGDLTGTTSPFSVGQIPVRNAAPIQIPWLAIARGAGAEGVGATEFARLVNYMKL